MRFLSLSSEVLCGTLDGCPLLRAELGRLGFLGGGARVAALWGTEPSDASGLGPSPPVRWVSASGV